MRRALFLCVLLALSGTAHAAAPPPQWLPQQSWPGGRQYDPRLGHTAKFWGTGVPAADLFADLAKQTGVALGFLPPDDDNARICLNVYLNPKEPPTLRDLLVQIGWVMDCAWAVEGEGEGRRYVLLHTNLGEGALAQRRRAQRERDWAWNQEEAEIQRQLQLRALARLRELAGDLDLSRGEAVRRYRGVDDQKLIVLLDPVRRSFAHFVLASPEVLARFPHLGGGYEVEWAQLTEEQRRYLRELVTAWAAQMAVQQPGALPQVPWDDPAAVAAWHLTVQIHPAGEGGGFYCSVGYGQEIEPLPDGSRVVAGALIHLASDPRILGPTPGEIEAEVRQLLGEEGLPEETLESQQRREEEQRLEQLRRRAEPELARGGPTSPQIISLLSSRYLHAKPAEPYALWQLQEWTAAVSGLHVVSDHFLQPAQPLQRYIGALDPAAGSNVDALTALKFAALPWATLEDSGWTWYPDGGDIWEWGEAGSFLRFRSRNRDLWRAALLPRAEEESLDSWLKPYLPTEVEPTGPFPEVQVPLDPLRQGRLLKALTPEQRRWGARIVSGDPTDPAEAYRRTFREGVRATGGRIPYELLAQLDEEQMRLLQGEGLVVGRDIPMATVEPHYPFVPHGPPPEEGSTLRLITTEARGGPSDGDQAQAPWEYRATVWSELRLLWSEGGYAELGSIPRNLLLRPQRLPHLTAPPEGYTQ
jgi:hypothetical protein